MNTIRSLARHRERLPFVIGILLICLTNAALGFGVVKALSMPVSVPNLVFAFGPALILVIISCLYWAYITWPLSRSLFSVEMLRFSPGALVLILCLAPLVALLTVLTTNHLGLTHSVIASVVILGLVGVTIAALYKVNWGLCLFLLVLPFALTLHVAFRSEQLVSDEVGYFAMNPETLLLLVTLTAVVLGLLVSKQGLVRTRLDIPIAIFIIATIISVFFSADIVHSSRIVFATAMAILCYYLVVNTVRTRNEFLLSVFILFLAFLLIGAYSLLAFGRETSELALPEGSIRADPTFTNPTFFASVLVLVIPLSICFAASSATSPKAKVGASLLAILLFAALIFTYTRGAWIAFGASVLVLLLCHKGFRSIFLKALPLLVVVFVVARDFWINLLLGRTYSWEHFLQSASWLGRLASWETSINMISHNPLTGVSPGMFMSSFQEYEVGHFSLTMSDAHNLFLHVGAESGIIAAIALLAMFGVALWLSYQVFRQSKDQLLRDASLGLFAALIGFLVYALATGDILVKYSIYYQEYYFFAGHSFYFFIFLGLIVALHQVAALKKQAPKPEEP